MRFAKMTILEIVAVAVFLGLVGYLYFNSSTYQPAPLSLVGTTTQVTTDTTPAKISVNIPDGWNIYTDEGLGYSLAYPPDWILVQYDNPEGLTQARQEKFWLTKGDAKILIDPLGRTGANEFTSAVTKTTETIDSIVWRHTYWPEKSYHRFTDENGSLGLKDDPTTNGVETAGGVDEPYSFRSDFRIHIIFPSVTSTEKQQDAINITTQILGTIRLL